MYVDLNKDTQFIKESKTEEIKYSLYFVTLDEVV